MLPDNIFDLLEDWVGLGWFRQIDWAFARFLSNQKPDSPDLAILCAALTSCQLGRGHICLDIPALLDDVCATLSLPVEKGSEDTFSCHPIEILSQISQPALEQSLLDSDLACKGNGNTPLVLFNDRIYLRRYWQYEQQVAQSILRRIEHQFSPPDNMSERLDVHFEPLRSAEELAKVEIHWQSIAAAVSAKSGISVISGGPGTGKTTAVVRLLGVLQEIAIEQGQKLRILVAAPTGKAAARLTASIGDAVSELPDNVKHHIPTNVFTLHRLLGTRPNTRHFVHNAQNPLHADLLIIDEASMIDLEMMAAILDALPETSRLILIGDKDQLASVEAGAVLGDLCRNADKAVYTSQTTSDLAQQTGYDLSQFKGDGVTLDQHIVVLRKSHRFSEKSGIGALARAVNLGRSDEVEAIWHRHYEDIAQLLLESTDDVGFANLVLNGGKELSSAGEKVDRPVGYREYLTLVQSGPADGQSEEEWFREIIGSFNRFQIIAALRKGPWGVKGLNEKTAAILFKKGLIPAKTGWYPGRPVLVVRNDYNLGLMNGDIGIVLPATEDHSTNKKTLKAIFQVADGSLKQVRPSRLSDVETAYAMTVHKSQGSEFDHASLILPDAMNPVLTRELVYTGITRARKWFTLVGTDAGLMKMAIKRRTHRASGLAELLSNSDIIVKDDSI